MTALSLDQVRQRFRQDGAEPLFELKRTPLALCKSCNTKFRVHSPESLNEALELSSQGN